MKIKSKRYWLTSIIMFGLLFCSTASVKAATIVQDASKEWTITFSKDVDAQSARNGIEVLDSNGVKQVASIVTIGNKVHISVASYTYGKTYEIIITDKVVDNRTGQSLVATYGKRFKVTTLEPQLYPSNIVAKGIKLKDIRIEQRLDIDRNKLALYDEATATSPVTLYYQRNGIWQEVGPMFDNGDLNEGDQLAGDNVYSTTLEALLVSTYYAQTIPLRIDMELSTGQIISTYKTLHIAEAVTEAMVTAAQDTVYRVNELVERPTYTSISDALATLQQSYLNQTGVVSTIVQGQQLKVKYANGYEHDVIVREENESYGTVRFANAQTWEEDNQVKGNKALIWSPYEYVTAPYSESEKVKELFKASPLKFDVHHLYGEAANVESLKTLSDYHYLHFIPYNNQSPTIITGQQVTKEDYLVEQGIKQIVASQLYALRDGKLVPQPKLVYAVTPTWLRQNIHSYFEENTLFYHSSAKHQALYQALENHGLGTYIAYSDKVSSRFAKEQAILTVANLLQQKPVKEAITTARDSYLATGASQQITGQKDTTFANYERVKHWSGLKNCYFAQFDYNATTPRFWQTIGEVRTASRFLGAVVPQSKEGMALLLTGALTSTERSAITQTFQLNEQRNLRVNWDVVADNFRNAADAKVTIRNGYNEVYSYPLTTPSIYKRVVGYTINQKAAWHVGWQKSDYLLPANFRNQQVTITIELVNKPWTADSAILAIDAIELY